MSSRTLYVCSIALFIGLMVSVGGCDEEAQTDDETSSDQQEQSQETADEQEDSDAEETDSSFSMDWEFVYDEELEDEPAVAWARVESPPTTEGDVLKVYIASADVDYVCEEEEPLEGQEKDVEEGQFVIEIETYDSFQDDPQFFNGEPGMFDKGRLDLYFYNEQAGGGTTSGYSSNPDTKDVELEIQEITDDEIVGELNAVSRSEHNDQVDRVSAQFVATLCEG